MIRGTNLDPAHNPEVVVPGDRAPAQKIEVLGTFNSTAVLGLQAGGVEDRIANATERTAKGVEGLRQDVKNNRPAFV